MSCNNEDKVFCCKKFYKNIFVENSETGFLEPVLMIQPIFCSLRCPEDCVENSYDPTLEYQYVTTIVDDCEKCLENAGCSDNYAVLFNKNTCEFYEEKFVSRTEAEDSVGTESVVVYFVDCSNTPLSKADPSTYTNITNNFLKIYKDCKRPCCYLLENNSYGCTKTHPSKCNIESIIEIIPKFNLNVIETILVEDQTSCSESNCYPEAKHYSENANGSCGVCCLGNDCLYLCNVEYQNIRSYFINELGISPPSMKGDISNFPEDVDSISRIVSAKEMCHALQGLFKGYNSVCGSDICSTEKNISK